MNCSSIVLLKNPYFQNNYSMSLSWGKIIIDFRKPLTQFQSPFPQGEPLQTHPATNMTVINGLVTFTSVSSMSMIVITSKTVMYNEVSEIVAVIYMLIGLHCYLKNVFCISGYENLITGANHVSIGVIINSDHNDLLVLRALLTARLPLSK